MAYVFDIEQVNSEITQVLKSVLESTSILKVLHDCRGDVYALKKHVI
jgi:ribonuclease D